MQCGHAETSILDLDFAFHIFALGHFCNDNFFDLQLMFSIPYVVEFFLHLDKSKSIQSSRVREDLVASGGEVAHCN